MYFWNDASSVIVIFMIFFLEDATRTYFDFAIMPFLKQTYIQTNKRLLISQKSNMFLSLSESY